jgi:hypothetical protein
MYGNNAMPVPLAPLDHLRRYSRRSLFLLLSLFSLILPTTLFAAGPRPSVRISLEDAGFLPLSPRYLIDGSSMLALHYVDSTHILVSFDARRLIPRVPNDPPTDQDHNVDLLLLELPSGRVLARSELLVHDHGQYLWNLGHGEFLLRIHDTFTTFAPLANLASGKPFLQSPFLRTSRHVIAVILSPQADFLTLESTDPLPLVDPDPSFAAAFGPSNRAPNVQLNFYRIGLPDPSGRIVPRNAGVAAARHAVDLPLTSEGLLNVLDQGHYRWAFDFKSHSGKRLELALFDSTCRPVPFFISPSEFLVFGCHGGTTRQTIAAFNLRGDATWQQVLSGSYVAPSFVFAPVAGRFALGRLIINSAVAGVDTLEPSMVLAESVDVIQNDSGKTLFHTECTPAARAGQNFALAPDGMSIAVIRDGGVEIYSLPPLGSQDKTAIQLAQKTAPPATEATVDLSEISTRIPTSSGQSDAEDSQDSQQGSQAATSANDSLSIGSQPTSPAPSASQATGTPTSPESSPTASPSTQASTPTETSDPPVRRKPPTLYNPAAPDPAAPPQ